jgi:hypothetical protein
MDGGRGMCVQSGQLVINRLQLPRICIAGAQASRSPYQQPLDPRLLMTPDSEKDMTTAHTEAPKKPLMAGNGATTVVETKPDKPKPKKENSLLSWIRTEIKTFNMNHLYLAAKSTPTPSQSD